MNTRKTITEAELRRRVRAGETHGEIAEELGFARSSIANTCAVLGITSIQSVRRRRQSTSSAASNLNAFLFNSGARQ